MTLRRRLTALLLALLTCALVFVGAASVWMLHSYLIQRVDAQIGTTVAEAGGRLGAVGADTLVLVRERDGRYRSPVGTARAVDRLPRPALPAPGRNVTVTAGSVDWRVRVTDLGRGRSLVVAVELSQVHEITRRLVLILVLTCGGVLAIVGVLGTVTVARRLRPLEEIGRTAHSIAAGELGQRVPVADPRGEVGHVAQALNHMLAELETTLHARARSEERMRQFVADASHELRTPLTSVRGFAQLAIENPGADSLALMRRVESAAGRMASLVDDLLLLARLDQQPTLHLQPVDLLTLAADAIQEARPLAGSRAITPVFSPEAIIVMADPVRLRQVVGNLLANALQHTDSPVAVRVGSAAGQAFLEVADKGRGLTAEQCARVFDRFYQAGGGRRGNSGLGLAIARSLMDAHGGSLTVESEVGAGSVFRIMLPAR